MPILQSPFDFREEDPRFAEALKSAMEIFGRLAVTLHAAYEEACRPGFPLLLSDRSKSEVQYAIANTESGFYHLVFFQGEEKHKQRFCSVAKVVLAPELALEVAKKKFLYHPKTEKDRALQDGSARQVYLEYFEDSSWIKGVAHSILVVFNRDHQIRSISAVYSSGAFQSYRLFGDRDFRIGYIQPSNVNRIYNLEVAEMITLNRDGVFRDDDGKTKKVDLSEELLEIASQLPMEHHIADRKVAG